MSKTLAKAALIVGAVALVATGVGAAASAGAFGTLAAGTMTAATAATLATVATVATVAGVAAGALSLAASLTAKKPSAQATGSQTSFSADPDAGIPYVVGRTGTAGNIVFRAGFDTADKGDNDRQAFVAALSLGPVRSVGGMTVDRAPVGFTGAGAAIGAFAGFMWSMTQVGALPSPPPGFGAGAGTPPGWTAQHRLSGLAAATWTLRFDTKAKLYQNGVPAPMWVVEGGFAYDPRKDSTYPGGVGPHRMADPADTVAYDAAVATWEYTENPYLHALKWVHGIWQRDRSTEGSAWQRVMGMGAPSAGIELAAFVEGANVADANGWRVGGVIYSGDSKWETLKKILQAGMGEPLALGARISCLVNAPKVSLATITIDDVVGDASVGATQPRRDRINTITPRYRLEQNAWQMLPGAPISVAAHVATDRGKRSKVQDYPFIQDSGQVGTAVRYDIENAREFGPIVLPLKLVWMGYKPGDCVTADLPELGLNGQPILLLNRGLDPSAGVVTMTARSETAGKHAYALGQTATPPPTPGVTGAPIVPVPAEGAWAITGVEVGAHGTTIPALIVTGGVDIGSAEAVIFEYRPFVSGQDDAVAWRGASAEPASTARRDITGVAPGTAYEVAVSYQVRGFIGSRRILGPVTTAGTQVPWDGVTGPAKPDDNATNGADPASPFGPGGTVGDVIVSLGAFDRALASAKARQDTLETVTIPAIDAAVADAGDRITAARTRADQALTDTGVLKERVDTLVAEGGYDDTDVRAKITQAAGVAANAAQAVGTLSTSVDTRFRGVSDTFADYDQRITTLSTGQESFATRVTTLEAQASPSGGNLVPNSALGTLDGWSLTINAGAASTMMANGAGAAWMIGGVENNFSLYRGPAGAGVCSEVQSTPFAVRPGSSLQFYAMTASHRCRAWVSIFFYNAAGFVGYGGENFGARINAGGQDIAAHDRTGAVEVVVPANALRATFVVRSYDVEADGYVWLSRPFVTEVKPGTATWVPYSAGNDRPVTTSAVARIKASEDALADLPNRYAAASRTATLEAQINFAADSGLQRTINARIEDRASAIADVKAGAVAQTVQTLRGQYDGTAATVSQQAGVIAGHDGKLASYIRLMTTAGDGRAYFNLWTDSNGGRWALGGDGLIDGNLTINGSVTARKFDGASMAREARSIWTGSVTPSPGATLTVPWSLALPSIPPLGRFLYEYFFTVATNAGTSQYLGNDGQGRPRSIQYVDDGGLTVVARDAQGNAYVPRANASDRIVAASDFAPTFTATIGRGATEYTETDGDNVITYRSATYTVTRLDLKVTWVAI